MPTAGPTDPRSIITPDAFEVSSALIGLPLAAPGRRAAALLIDGIVISFLPAVTRNVPLLLGVVAAGLFIRAGFRRTPVRGSVFGRAMRLSVGCLGVFVALLTAIVAASVGLDLRSGGDGDGGVPSFDGLGAVVLEQLATRSDLFADVETPDEAREIATEVVDAFREAGVQPARVRTILLAAIPADAPWTDDPVAFVDALPGLAPTDLSGEASAAVPPDGAASAEAAVANASTQREVAELSDVEVLVEYVRVVTTEAEPVAGRRALLERRVATLVAADTLRLLEARIEALQEDVARGERQLDRARERVAEFEGRGIFERLKDLADELGFGFGWAAVYMTIMLSWWNGQTVGKRLLGIRVLRLDGGPITWWVAFERVGGYAAGLATGLLGFAQVWWDSNRQAIHDRIVGTVVVVDGAEKVIDWESAL